MKWESTAFVLLQLIVTTHAYAFPKPTQSSRWATPATTGTSSAAKHFVSRSRSTTSLAASTQKKPEELRREIAERNSLVEDEAQYAVADGELLERMGTTDAVAAEETDVKTDYTDMYSRMKRMTKPRAYPLFLAEKGVEFLEGTVHDIAKSFQRTAETGAATSTSDVNGSVGQKERVVVLGTGWGSASLLKEIDTDLYDVTVISPRNYFLFTPMLAGASVGTVEYRSITEPIRAINPQANFLEATATNIDTKTNTVTCESVICEGNSCDIQDFSVQYDRLVVAVGAQTNTFGIPGVKEYCNYLRQVEDARRVRTSIINCFERANLPGLSDEERIRNLTFAVIGAGPTGIEFAAELRDFVEEDGPKYYPKLLQYVRIKVIEASPMVLAPFDKELQQEAIAQLKRPTMISDPKVAKLLPPNFQMTELLLEASVKEVKEDRILLNNGQEIPYGIAVWAAGNGPIPLTLQLIESLGDEQASAQAVARGRVAVDCWMRAIGGQGKVLSFGDCSCMFQQQLPATAQVASQQGEYLAKLLNKKFEFTPALTEDGIFPPPRKDPARTQTSFSDAIAAFASNNYEYAKPFQFLNLGILAYTGGGSALAQVTPVPDGASVQGKGKLGNALWRSVYLTKQVSWRNRLLVMNDWTKRRLFGRDITRL
jgi:NADH dehydrogenase FAD-containing subunit|uniref:NADH:ubiquinone reductase (non-electrogenic) n=1 Tax=Phaeodactylum tricornutum TaxID=2850 RepID=A0A8J9TFD5_PHATR